MEEAKQNGQPPDVPGGKGGGCSPNLSPDQTSDTRLAERAVRERWPIPAEVRAKLPAMLAGIIDDAEASPRNKIAAARVLLTADGLNLEQEQRDAGGETVNVNVRGAVEVREVVVSTREQADRLPGLAGAGPVPGRNGAH